ncbi:ABC transporter permease [Aeromicrobium sp. REDSEA-S32_B7]|uniref:ABC transporter permease n=1 Tax=Aeromicrobium sp. REDSEA-S32_B7 TaxID=1811526 RepID=UPI000A9E998A|nr:ABC transporter permease [Aeromicrobium sp. REDSEA-S32_B7]
MRSVVPALLRAGAGSRALVVVAATAVATAVLMAAASIAMLWFERIPSDLVIDARGYGTDLESVNWIVADPGTRGGVLFGAIVLVLPPLLLLDQAVRLGAASRQRRDAALRLAGATRRDVRALAALEVALPALVGGVLGIPTFLLLRSLLAGPGFLAPTSFPPLWVVPLVLVGVALVGAGVGARAGKDDPLGTRLGPHRPRPGRLRALGRLRRRPSCRPSCEDGTRPAGGTAGARGPRGRRQGGGRRRRDRPRARHYGRLLRRRHGDGPVGG